ncbi:MAG: GAF domain-containing protein [Candidatus Krumholzibacteria bacterium]|nr:GAF domain-containing protein [Candidatus Krumholzibacteria bacterium]
MQDFSSESASAETPGRGDRKRLERQSMRNWYLLAVICAVSTVGLLLAVTPNLQGPLRDFWPGGRTDLALIVGLGGSVLLLVLYLTIQQVKVTHMRLHVQDMEDRVGERKKQNAIRLHALLNVTRMMGAVSDPVRLFHGITSTCLEIFDCQQASLMIVSADGRTLQMKAASGHLDEEKVRGVSQSLGQGIAGYVAKHRESLLLGENVDPDNYPGLELDPRGLFAAMVVPIVVRDELVGVLNISSRSQGTSYTEEDLQALEVFAINAGTCIHQAERTEWMRQTVEAYRDKEQREKAVEVEKI